MQFISPITPFPRVGEYDAMAVAQGLDISGRKGVKAARKVKSGPKLAAMNTIESENEKEGGLPAVSTAWDIPVISLPNGCNSLPIDLIPLLDRFTTIYLWLDNDKSGKEQSSVLCLTKTPSVPMQTLLSISRSTVPCSALPYHVLLHGSSLCHQNCFFLLGQDSATKFAHKLGLKRCYIVKPNALMEVREKR